MHTNFFLNLYNFDVRCIKIVAKIKHFCILSQYKVNFVLDILCYTITTRLKICVVHVNIIDFHFSIYIYRYFIS